MGQKESIHHHILMYGQSGHGKTNFLYDNFLNGKWDEEQQKVESSLGYNFELITTAQDQNYGVWDISGHPEIEEEQLTAGGDGDVSAETLELLIDEIKELIKYDQIQIQQKGIIIMDRSSSYIKLWEKVASLIQGVKAIEKKKDQQKD